MNREILVEGIVPVGREVHLHSKKEESSQLSIGTTVAVLI